MKVENCPKLLKIVQKYGKYLERWKTKKFLKGHHTKMENR